MQEQCVNWIQSAAPTCAPTSQQERLDARMGMHPCLILVRKCIITKNRVTYTIQFLPVGLGQCTHSSPPESRSECTSLFWAPQACRMLVVMVPDWWWRLTVLRVPEMLPSGTQLACFQPNTVVLRLSSGELCVVPEGACMIAWPGGAAEAGNSVDTHA
eukprot:scaffold305910_cov21-Tisochrysis_lutea.AAC.1